MKVSLEAEWAPDTTVYVKETSDNKTKESGLRGFLQEKVTFPVREMVKVTHCG